MDSNSIIFNEGNSNASNNISNSNSNTNGTIRTNSIENPSSSSISTAAPSYDDYHTRLVNRLRTEHEERRARERETEERLLNGK